MLANTLYPPKTRTYVHCVHYNTSTHIPYAIKTLTVIYFNLLDLLSGKQWGDGRGGLKHMKFVKNLVVIRINMVRQHGERVRKLSSFSNIEAQLMITSWNHLFIRVN